ncbi:uncharacterized protein PG986_006902 [Apiospora aurea]|uniref:Uncharacterized protein n=1 Tax=Apiospora aurea TaxID=335848 RepID=A0ABR1QB22_9PEZI
MRGWMGRADSEIPIEKGTTRGEGAEARGRRQIVDLQREVGASKRMSHPTCRHFGPRLHICPFATVDVSLPVAVAAAAAVAEALSLSPLPIALCGAGVVAPRLVTRPAPAAVMHVLAGPVRALLPSPPAPPRTCHPTERQHSPPS